MSEPTVIERMAKAFMDAYGESVPDQPTKDHSIYDIRNRAMLAAVRELAEHLGAQGLYYPETEVRKIANDHERSEGERG
ncbi:MAG: hypothetical protein ACR2QF_07225 [Geminicoccaceae bacterium]